MYKLTEGVSHNLTGIPETDIPILRYLDVDQIIPILESKNQYFIGLVLDVIRLYKENDQEYLNELVRWAAENGHYQIFGFLVEKGADINTRQDYALRWAVINGHTDIVILMFQNVLDNNRYWLVDNGYFNMIKVLMEEGMSFRCYLNFAIRKGYIDIVKLIIENSTDKDILKDFQWVITHGNLEMVKYYIKKGVDVKDGINFNIRLTIYHDNLEIFEFLIKEGADVNTISDDIELLEARQDEDYAGNVVEMIYELRKEAYQSKK